MEEEEKKYKEFRDIQARMTDTFRRKNHDYGNAFHDVFRKRGWAYALGLMENKINRIDVLSQKDAMVENESIKDSLLDLANYAILTLMEVQQTESVEDPAIKFFTEGKL